MSGDFATTPELELAFRAGALCLAAEPHRGAAPWPCDRCLLEAKRQLSVPASSTPSEVPAASLASATEPPALLSPPRQDQPPEAHS